MFCLTRTPPRAGMRKWVATRLEQVGPERHFDRALQLYPNGKKTDSITTLKSSRVTRAALLATADIDPSLRRYFASVATPAQLLTANLWHPLARSRRSNIKARSPVLVRTGPAITESPATVRQPRPLAPWLDRARRYRKSRRSRRPLRPRWPSAARQRSQVPARTRTTPARRARWPPP